MIKIDARGLDEVKAALDDLTGKRPYVGIVTEAAAKEVVDIMQSQPDDTPYQYISRANAYPDAVDDNGNVGYFKTGKQHRFVMALLRRRGWDGKSQPPAYQRTGKVSGAWRVVGRLSKAKVVNDNAAAPYVFGDKEQSRHEDAVGWEKVSVRLDNQSNRIFDAAYDALAKYIASRKKK